MAHKSTYGGKTPTKKVKKAAKEEHKMPGGHMMKDSEMKKMQGKMMKKGKKK